MEKSIFFGCSIETFRHKKNHFSCIWWRDFAIKMSPFKWSGQGFELSVWTWWHVADLYFSIIFLPEKNRVLDYEFAWKIGPFQMVGSRIRTKWYVTDQNHFNASFKPFHLRKHFSIPWCRNQGRNSALGIEPIEIVEPRFQARRVGGVRLIF